MDEWKDFAKEGEDGGHADGAIDGGGTDGPRERHDAFNGEKKRIFLHALARTGCILDAAKLAKVASRTVYNHYESDREFAHHYHLALKMAATDIELMAFERGVIGIEEDIVRDGKVVGTRIKRSDSVLRLLLQGANRKKYGPRPGFSRKKVSSRDRKQIERELRAKQAAKRPSKEALVASIGRKLTAMNRRLTAEDASRAAAERGDG